MQVTRTHPHVKFKRSFYAIPNLIGKFKAEYFNYADNYALKLTIKHQRIPPPKS